MDTSGSPAPSRRPRPAGDPPPQERLGEHFAEVGHRALEQGSLPAGTDPAAVAQVLQSLVVGYAVQHQLMADLSRERYLSGVAALLGG